MKVWREQPESMIWVNIPGALTPELREQLAGEFGLHALALQDASRDRHPPKFEPFEDHSFLIYKGLTTESQTIDANTIQLAVFVGERFLLTRHSAESVSVLRLSEDLETRWAGRPVSPAVLATRLARLVVDRYLGVLMALEPRLEEIEATILSTGDDTTLAELIGHKSDLTRLRRFCRYHVAIAREVHEALPPGFGPDTQHELLDVQEQWERAASLADLYYQQATDLIEGYISVSSHRLNQIMRVLTIITAIFVPLGFLAGIYGMNFENIPELHSRFGYFILLAVMAGIAAVLLLTFRFKRWL